MNEQKNVTRIEEGALKVKKEKTPITDIQKSSVLEKIECVDCNHSVKITDDGKMTITIDLTKRIDALSASGDSYRIESIPFTSIGNGIRIAFTVTRTFRSFFQDKTENKRRLNIQ